MTSHPDQPKRNATPTSPPGSSNHSRHTVPYPRGAPRQQLQDLVPRPEGAGPPILDAVKHKHNEALSTIDEDIFSGVPDPTVDSRMETRIRHEAETIRKPPSASPRERPSGKPGDDSALLNSLLTRVGDLEKLCKKMRVEISTKA